MKQVLVFIGVCLLGTELLAQAAPPATPIDGGLTLALLATGTAIGVKKIRDRKK